METRSEEDYIKCIFNLSVSEKARVQTSEIANALNTSAASVTDMIQKLAHKGYIDYKKYKGSRLKSKGSKIAIQLIRRHRLWELFLVERLQYDWGQVHDIAEQLEHIQSEDLIDRLEAYLGYPTKDPHGEPIPDKNGITPASEMKILNQLSYPKEYTLAQLRVDNEQFIRILDHHDLKIGDKIYLEEILEYDESVRVRIKGQSIQLSAKVAQNLYVH